MSDDANQGDEPSAGFLWDPIKRADGQRVQQCDLSGHFFAEVSSTLNGVWAYTIRNYENETMARGTDRTERDVKAAVVAWDEATCAGETDPEPLAD
jgi:hypothetical protein